MLRSLVTILVLAISIGVWASMRGERSGVLVVHEWGTFTSLQDPGGRTIHGINTDDEPVPGFVHRFPPRLIEREADLPQGLNPYSKGLPSVHPDVAMRLETPVMYFYPPPEGEAKKTLTLDVRVEFHGGWLTEFYPNAGATAPGITLTDQGAAIIGRLEPHAIGSLEWNGLRIGEPVTLPETDDAVWLHPRAVNSAPVSTTDGEGERYLFYRGVANLESPVRAIRRAGMLSIDSPFDVAAMWLVDLRADQSLAYRPVNIRGAAAGFEAAAYHADNPARLRTSMRRALIADGLFADEADAMLNTWEAAYFRTPGLRLFYLVPQTWTDRVLPLRLSVPAKVSRTMVGRIELVTDRQRELLDQIAAGPASESGWMMKLIDGTTMKMPVNTLAELRASGVEKPADFDAYLQLGRFRDALIYDRLKHRPTEALRKFAVNYGIFPYVKVK